MKINFYERDSRKNDLDFEQTAGSFSIICHIIRDELKKLDYYTENPEEADFVGIADSLSLNWQYPEKKTFIIAFLDNINTISHLQYEFYYRCKPILFSINQHTADLYKKYGIDCQVIGPGIKEKFWYQTKSKNEIFTFFHNGYSNYRSGIEILIDAFKKAFEDNKKVQLIIKNTSDNKILEQIIKDCGSNVKYLNSRITHNEMRDLYSQSHVFCSIFRMSGHGIGIAEAGLCNCLVLTGDFNPSNKINQHGILLKPEKEINIYDYMETAKQRGLSDTFGQLFYFEQPRFYDYNISEYSELLQNIYLHWENKYSKINSREKILEVWNTQKSAENLIRYLNEKF